MTKRLQQKAEALRREWEPKPIEQKHRTKDKAVGLAERLNLDVDPYFDSF